ncbi:hypothetical protein EV368DRAFT_61667 [Lentinula lateritia]|uniref:Uncharacterized protein n=1 Tax=Lentinula aff. lateritia TaxID=2804960 RepID=A0ACC1TQG4_9AGAR|nr:hypothetical protein F5876DRAFT_68695 [Lentinula aff. lateritia]KAJ3856449.1 hypothetical protein EV368DRAFT_61667 [Lentinula lateritia]
MICDAHNRPIFRRPRKDPATGRTTPATRKAWLRSQLAIFGSSVEEHSVICKNCQNLIPLHPRLLYQIENWQIHINNCDEQAVGGEPARKRRRITRSSESGTKTQMTLRSRRSLEVEDDERLAQDPDKTDEEVVVSNQDIEELENHRITTTRHGKPVANGYRTPFVEIHGRNFLMIAEDYPDTFYFFEYDYTTAESSTSRFPISNERGSREG